MVNSVDSEEQSDLGPHCLQQGRFKRTSRRLKTDDLSHD